MTNTSNTSDIETILNTQIWRHKLPSMSQSQKHFKIRAKTEIEKPRKAHRMITDPAQYKSHEFQDEFIEKNNDKDPKPRTKKSIFLLAGPLSTISEAAKLVSCKTSNFIVPSFPKRKFGEVSKTVEEKFLVLKEMKEDKVLQMKIENGRVGKNLTGKQKVKFEFTRDFRRISEDFSERVF